MSDPRAIKGRHPQGFAVSRGTNRYPADAAMPFALLLALFLALLLAMPGLLRPTAAHALPVSVEQARKGAYLAESALYYVDTASEMDIEQAGSPLMQSNYSRLSNGIPLFSTGTLWLKFSLLADNSSVSAPLDTGQRTDRGVIPLPGINAGVALRLPADSPAAKVFVPQEVTPSGHVRKWRQIQPDAVGNYPLPMPRGASMPVFAQLSGIPGLWFNPMLVAQENAPPSPDSPLGGETELSADTVLSEGFVNSYLPLLLQALLVLCLVICLVRGLFGHDEWRVWACAVIGCVLVQAVFLRQGTYPGAIYLTALPGLLAPGLAIMLIPHLGRHLLQSKNSKGLDYALIILSLPGVAAALIPLIPGLSWTAKLLPLAPLLLLPLLIPAAAALLQGRRGSATFLLLCLLPLTGALLALVGFGLAIFQGAAGQPLFRSGAWLTLWAYTAACLVLALSFPRNAKKEKQADFFPLGHGGGHLAITDAPDADDPFGEPEIFTRNGELSLHPLHSPHQRPTPDAKIENPTGPSLEDVFGPGSNDTGPEIDGHDKNFPDIAFPEPERNLLPGLENLAGEVERGKSGADGSQPELLSFAGASDDPFSDMLESSDGVSLTEKEPAREAQGQLYPNAGLGQNGSAPTQGDLPPAPGAEAAGPGKADELGGAFADESDLVYIKDQEEPGLVIIKPRRLAEQEPGAQRGEAARQMRDNTATLSVPLAAERPHEKGPYDERDERVNLAALHEQTGLSGRQLLNELMRSGAVARLEESLDLRDNIEELKRQQSNAADLSDNLEQVLHSLGLALNNLDLLAHGEGAESLGTRSIFNLSNLVRRAHAEILPIAEDRGVTLSWFVAPTLPLLYKGEEDSIKNALTYMLRGAVESADAGAVQLAVRQSPEGGEGIIRFTLVDSSMNPNSMRRPARLLSRAWELARASQGAFSIEFIPNQGTYIHFSLRLQPLIDDDDAWYNSEPAQSQAEQPATLQQTVARTAAGAPRTLEELAPESGTEPSGLLESTEQAQEAEQTELFPQSEKTIFSMGSLDLPEEDFPLHDSDDMLPQPEEVAPEEQSDPLEPDFAKDAETEDEEPLELLMETIVQPAAQTEETEPEQAPVNQPFPDEAFAPASPDIQEESTELIIAPEAMTPLEAAPDLEPRNTIVIADMAASGRRLIARRLSGLPHPHFEARSAREIVNACASHNVALIILDADMPENEVMLALEEITASEAAVGRSPVPCLCLVSHNSQIERMRRLGCTECQVKSAGRAEFQAVVLQLAPHHAASGQNELGQAGLAQADLEQATLNREAVFDTTEERPEALMDAFEESRALAGPRPPEQADAAPEAAPPVAEHPEPAPDDASLDENSARNEKLSAAGKNKKKKREKTASPDRSVPMLDLIVSNLDNEAQEMSQTVEAPVKTDETDETDSARAVPAEAPVPAAQASGKDLTRLSGSAPGAPEEYMDSGMVPLIPGFLEVLKESLFDLARGVNARDAAAVQEVAARMCGQGKTFGLSNLERMAACVERAAAAEDQEAISDLAEELLNLGNRHLLTLRLTHDDYLKNNV